MAPPYSITITNAGAESGNMTGWTLDRQSIEANTGPLGAGLNPNTGTYFFQDTDNVGNWTLASQVIDLTTATSATTSEFDDESLMIDLDWQQANSAVDDQGMMLVEFLDGSGNTIWGASTIDRLAYGTTTVWNARQIQAPIPPGTRQIRIWMAGRATTGNLCDAAWDDISGSLIANTFDSLNKRAWIVFRSATQTPPSYINEAIGISDPSVADLKDQDGVSTGWGWSYVSGSINAVNDTHAMPIVGVVPNDYARGSQNVQTATAAYKFTGLDTSKTYNIRIIGSRDRSGTRTTQFTVEGSSQSFETEFNIEETAEFLDVSPDGSGEIDVSYNRTGSATFGYITGVEIEENADSGSGGGPVGQGGQPTIIIIAC